MTEPYPKEQVDLKLQLLEQKVETYHVETMAELSQHRDTHNEILKKLDYTNGKVKKIIIALTAIGAFALGTGLQNLTTLLKFIL